MKVPWFGFKRWLWAKSKFRVSSLAYALGGLGDELMLTAVASEACRSGRPFHVLTHRPEIWSGNRDVLGVETNSDWWFYAIRRKWSRAKHTHVLYENGNHTHIAQQMAAHLGLSLPVGWRPKILYSAGERIPKRIVLQNSCRGALYSAATKEWPQERWTILANRLAQDFELIQVGTTSDPLIPCAKDRRGRTTIGEAATLLSSAACFVGLESGLMHLAAATSTPSVIIYGGRSRPHETGYLDNRNLCLDPGCAGCGLNQNCPHGIKCMDIPIKTVEDAVRQAVA